MTTLACCHCLLVVQGQTASNWYEPDHHNIQYTGRIDFTHPKLPRYWQPGVQFAFRFAGSNAAVVLQDEMLYGSNHNYIELVVDGKPFRLQTKTKRDTLWLKPYISSAAAHDVVVVKNTEANIGYLELAAVACEQLLEPLPKPSRKIECIGNSITCGASSDTSEVPCHTGKWQDQHNAYLSYGMVAARNLHAQVHLSSVSGIGLMHSCCNMDVVMPQVFDKVSMRNDSILWNFSKYQPDVVTVCLGQNDGIRDTALFCQRYLAFMGALRSYYPNAHFLLLSSPMAHDALRQFQRQCIQSVLKQLHAMGEDRVEGYIFEKQYASGCDYHPSISEHRQIASEVTQVIRKMMQWE